MRPAPSAAGQVRFADGALSGTEWIGAVAEAVGRIGAGELDKVVLARDLEVARRASRSTRGGCCAGWPRRYPAAGRSRVDGLVGATPELLVRLERAWSPPGCWPARSGAPATTSTTWRWRRSLARSSKDLEEHEYAVRSVADALRAALRAR